MRKKLTIAGLTGLLLVLAIPLVAFAGTEPFSASGSLDQTGAGTGGVAAGYVSAQDAQNDAPDIAQAFFDGIYGSTPVDQNTDGFQTLDQPFDGQLFESNWKALDDADMVVSQNSWFTADPDTGEVVGVAWGTFDITKGSGNELAGEYAAFITGTVAESFYFGVDCPDSGLFVRVEDEGIWEVDETSVSGAYEKLGPLGMLGDFSARAAGCLGHERAIVTINGERVDGKSGDSRHSDHNDHNDRGDRGDRNDRNDRNDDGDHDGRDND